MAPQNNQGCDLEKRAGADRSRLDPDQALWPGATELFRDVGTRQPTPPILSAPLTMPLQFHHAVEKIEIWSATTDGYSFVISFESPAGTGFHGRFGYLASWRAAHHSRGAVKIGGSPFATFEEAEAACNVTLEHLTAEN